MTSPAGLVVWPGAGADRDHRTLCALEAGCGVPVRRMDHAYRLAGRGAPGKADVDVTGVVAAVNDAAAAWGVPTSSVVIGGRSYGGRMCSLAVAEGLKVAGLVLLSYPLHPPGKPDRLRTEHFGDLDVPVLFVSGTRDPFGSPGEFETHVERIPAPVQFVWLGGGHDPRNDDAVTAAVATWLSSPVFAGQ